MSQNRRMKKLQRKARIARQDTAHSSKTTRSRKTATVRTDGTPMGVVFSGEQAMEELMREDPTCRESLFLPSGVAIKVYDRRIWVVAPRRMQEDPAFFELLNEVMIDHFCGHDAFQEVCRQHGFDAGMKLLEDVITDVDYYDDSP